MKIPKCAVKCSEANKSCNKSDCRHWIDYKKEHNCCLVSIYVNGQMTLREVAERLGLSFSRIKQIETKALAKLKEKYTSNNPF